MAITFAPEMITPAQSNYIQSLLAARITPKGLAAGFSLDLTKSQASNMITKLKKCPVKAPGTQGKAAAKEIVPEGFYCVGIDYFKVQTSKTTGKRYAKIWTGSTWSYNAGGVYKLTLADKLTEEQAAMFGKKTGHCCICSKLLTNPESVAKGIGPVCADNMGW
jgi:hypothetical protein